MISGEEEEKCLMLLMVERLSEYIIRLFECLMSFTKDGGRVRPKG
jgi:hypothetical protein